MDEEERRHKELMAFIRDFEEKDERLHQQKAPMVGVLFVIDKQVYCDGTFRDLLEPSPDGIVRWRSHEDTWHRLIALLMPDTAPAAPYHYPRGRVVYSEDRQRFFLYVDYCAMEDEKQKKNLIQKVCRKFNLDQSLLEALPSPDYRCANCL